MASGEPTPDFITHTFVRFFGITDIHSIYCFSHLDTKAYITVPIVTISSGLADTWR